MHCEVISVHDESLYHFYLNVIFVEITNCGQDDKPQLKTRWIFVRLHQDCILCILIEHSLLIILGEIHYK